MKNGLNVCLMNDSFPPVIDGVANAVKNYGMIIAGNYGRATVVTPQYPGAADDYPFDVVRYPSLDTERQLGYRTGMPLAPRVFGLLKDRDFDIIHTHCPIMSTVLARLMREELCVPAVFTYHTKFDIDIADMIKSQLVQKAALKAIVSNIEACDEVWVVSRGAGENLRGIGYRGNYVVMRNGVDFPRGRVSGAAAAAVRQKHGIGPEETVFLFVGRLMWYKGIGLILDGLKKIKDSGRSFRMVFVGGGADSQEIERYAADIGLGGECVFAGAVQDRELLRAYFCGADLFLFPSTFDTNGIVVREAAACGLPSVLVRGSCAAEGAADGQNAFLIDGNADSMAKAADMAFNNIEAVRRTGERAMDELYISWEQSVARAVERYGTVIENYRSRAARRDVPRGDPLFAAAADVEEKLNAVREIRLHAEERGRAAKEKAWQLLERYL